MFEPKPHVIATGHDVTFLELWRYYFHFTLHVIFIPTRFTSKLCSGSLGYDSPCLLGR